jgi:O-antigen/teichoic acid export membrane protein
LDEWHVKPIRGFVSKELRIEIIKLSFFSILSGSAGVLISNIDIIMVNQKLGLTQTGIYGIAFYFGTIIMIPSRALGRIAVGVISEAFKNENIHEIKSLYKKSCNSQLAIGLLLYIGIWVNIDNIMHLLPPEYAAGKNVILLIGAGYLIDMGTGINYLILLNSKYYRYDMYFMVFILFLTVLSNYVLIPIYGIEGSAMATAITIAGYNILRWVFLYIKLNMQPYDGNTLKLLTIGVISFLPGYFLPQMNTLIFDIAIRSLMVGGLFMLLMFKLKAAPEINNKIEKNLKSIPFLSK